MKRTLLTIIVTLVALGAIVTAYMYSGAYDISQLDHHNAITKWMIGTTTRYSIKKRTEDIKVPQLNDSSLIKEGFVHYNELCVICHGAPGIEPGELTRGLYPRPPRFYKSNDMPETTEAFWIIKNGIKMTSMPSFGLTHPDQKIWAITDFLLNEMNKMSPEEYSSWQRKYSETGTGMER